MTTSQKLWVGFGTVTALLVLFGVTLTVRLRSIEVQVGKMSNVARPRAAAARELEVHVIDYALAVRTFTQTDDPKFRQDAVENAGEVERHLADYQRLASTGRQRELAGRFAALWRGCEGIGQVILDSKHRPLDRAGSERLAELRTGLERLLNDEMQPEAAESYDARMDATHRDVRSIVWFAVILLVVGVVIAVVTSVAVGRAVVRGERAVAEHGERLRTTLASIGDAVITTDAAGRVTDMNPVAESLTAWSNAEAAGQPLDAVFDIVNEDTRKKVENPASRASREGVIVGLANHTVLIAKDGTERPVDDSAAPIRCKAGEVVGCVLVFRDVTERRRAELALEERASLLRLGAEVGTALTVGGDLRAVLQTCTESMVRNLDAAFAGIWTVDEAGDVPELQASAGLYTHIDGPHGRVPVGRFEIGLIAQERKPHLTDAVVGDPRVPEQEWARREGMVAFAGYPLLVDDRLVGVMAVFARHPLGPVTLEAMASVADEIAIGIRHRREVQAQRHALIALREGEEFNRSLMDGSSDCIKVLDVDGRLLHMNTPGLCTMEIDDFGPLCGRQWADVWPSESSREIERSVASAAGGKPYTFQAFCPTAKGSARWWDVAVSPVRSTPGGQVVRLLAVSRDITERKRAEENVVTTLNSISDGFMRFDRDWRVVYVNDEAERIVQRPRAELLGHTHWELFPATVGTKVEGEYRRAVAERVTVELENYYEPLGGWYAIRAYPTPDGGLVIYFLDITARKEAERLSREGGLRLRFVMDSMPQKIFTATPTGDVDYFNPIWTEFTGLSFERIRDWGWTRFIHPDDVDENVRAWKHSVETGQPFQFEHRFRRHDGEYRWHMSRAVPMRDDAGRVVMWIGSNTEIHDVKRAEQTARFVAEVGAALAELNDPVSTLQKVASMSVPSFSDWCAVDMVDEGGKHRRVAVMHADPVKLRAYGELMGRYPPRTDDKHGIPHVLRTGEPDLLADIPDSFLAAVAHDEEHHRLLRGMGLKSHVLVPIRSHGRTLGVLAFITAESGRRYTPDDLRVAQDLARRAAVAIENAELYHALQEADRRKDEFLATLAHELRNPLAPIRNGLQIMRLAGDNGEAVGQARTMMERQLGQMVRLVDDLLDVSRISRGKLELRKGRVDLAGVLDNAVETSRPLIDAGDHELRVVMPPEPVFVDADVTRLGQVFANLLNNAAKYSERGGRIRLTAGREGDDVVVRVEDSGVGIPPAMLPKVFDLFTQVDRSLEKSQGGLGIGLTLVRRLVELHGGSVEARSEGHGLGSEFVVRLPVASSAVRGSEPTARTDEPFHQPGRCRILVADDNADSAASLSMLLGIMGNEVRTANDGLQAVRAAEQFRPDVILLDIGMPCLNGYDACRRIREQPWGRRAVLIALTGWGQDEDRRRSREAGFDHHMVKPVDPAALEKLLAGLPAPAGK